MRVHAFCIVGFEGEEKATESLGGLEFRGRGFVVESPSTRSTPELLRFLSRCVCDANTAVRGAAVVHLPTGVGVPTSVSKQSKKQL